MDASLSDDSVEPRSSATLTITLKTRQYEESFAETVEITTNDPRHPSLKLVLRGRVEPLINVAPAGFNFGVVSSTELPVSESIAAWGNIESTGCCFADWWIDGAEADDLVTDLEIQTDQSRATVTMTLKDTTVPGPIQASLVICVLHEQRGELRREVQCFGKVIGPIGAIPDSLLWNVENLAAGGTKEVRLLRTRGRRLHADVSDSLREWIDVQVEKESLTVSLHSLDDGSRAPGRASGVIWVLGETGRRLLRVPVSLVVE